MGYERLRLADKDGVRWITVSRPEKMNALDRATVAELATAAEEAEGDGAVAAVVLTGAGDKAFVAGADIAELKSLAPEEAKEVALAGQEAFGRFERMTKPTVAAVNGYALGGGCVLAMACHFRIASASAVFGQPEVKLGLIPGYGGTQRLPRLVGRGRALEILTTGRMVPAAEAERIGLVHRVVEATALAPAVDELLSAILANGPEAVGRTIEAVRSGTEMALDDALLLEATLFGASFGSEEMTEGTEAFLEKRSPRFGGR